MPQAPPPKADTAFRLQQEAGKLHHSSIHAAQREAGQTRKVWPRPLHPEVALWLPPAFRQAGPLFAAGTWTWPHKPEQPARAGAVTSARLTPFGVSPLGEQGQLCISQMRALTLPLSPQPVGCSTVEVTDTEGVFVVTRVGRRPLL